MVANLGEGANFLIRSYAQETFRRATLVRGTCLGLVILLVLLTPSQGDAYAVLAHQAEIDVVWESHLKPLLHRKFPKATEDVLDGAEAYAYGGAIIQDLGYYPYGSRFFSKLAHYLRSGDFVTALLRDSEDVDEYAFALGALSHYASDIDGHRVAVNPSVPKLYPKLQKKYGDRVTYEDDPLAHVQTEFGFDVLQVARGRYASDEFHDFIGFEVSQRLLDQVFLETYGLPLSSVLLDEEKALNSYRRDVSKLIPRATRVAWSLKSKEIQAEEPSATHRKFLYNLSRADFEKQWGKNYRKPTAGERFLAFLYKLLPKFGPLRVLQLRLPTPDTEKLFEASFNASLDRYRNLLVEEGEGRLQLRNTNFDVGADTPPGQYRLNDDTHAELLNKLAQNGFKGATPELQSELLQFFDHPEAPYATKKDAKAWARVQTELQRLRGVHVPLMVPPGSPSHLK